MPLQPRNLALQPRHLAIARVLPQLGALAVSHGIGLHVDNCLGGYLLSFMQVHSPWTTACP